MKVAVDTNVLVRAVVREYPELGIDRRILLRIMYIMSNYKFDILLSLEAVKSSWAQRKNMGCVGWWILLGNI